MSDNNIKLLPLPSSMDSWFVQKMEAYARDNVAYAVTTLQAELVELQAENARLRSILIDLKDWDCDVSGGFLSIPLYLRRRMQEAIDAHPAHADEAVRRDAARYRWLRKGESDDVAVVCGLGSADYYGMSAVLYTYRKSLDGDDLDAAIDEAMKEEANND